MKTKFYLTFFACVLFAHSSFSFQDSQKDLLSKLTGHSEIVSGTKLTDRYTQNNRSIAADYLKKQLLHFTKDVNIENYRSSGNNVIAKIPATKKTNQWVLLGAHYDSVRDCPGANDNGTGVALVYEVARYISSLKQRKFNVMIVFFDEEEKGLIGSKALAKELKEESVDLIAAHTIDQMGWDDDGDLGIELEMPTDELKELYMDVAKKHGYKMPIHLSKVTSTDHSSFRRQGFAAIGLTEEYVNQDTTPHYHKSTDTFETVNLKYLYNTTEFVKKVFEQLLK